MGMAHNARFRSRFEPVYAQTTFGRDDSDISGDDARRLSPSPLEQKMPEALFLVLTVVVVLTLGMIFWAVFALTRAKLGRVAAQKLSPGSDGYVEVPLAAAFGGWKGLPWIAATSSDIAPLLRLGPDRLEYRVIRLKSRPYSDVSRVDVRTTIGTVNIVIDFHGSWRNFAGNAASLENAAEAIEILARKGCPLSNRAEQLRATIGAEQLRQLTESSIAPTAG